jgi:4-aminobutyrate aminotransferase
MGVAGAAPLSRDLSRSLREMCDRHGIKLVADEVITGFGRTGEWFGSQAVGLEPDAMVFAKGFTGGYAPLGAVVFERSWGAALRRSGFPHGLTFGAHPLGCVAARETIRILTAERLIERCRRIGAYAKRKLEGLREDHPSVVRDVRGLGLLLAMELRGRGRRSTGELHPGWARVEPIWNGLRNAGIRVTTNNDGSSILLCPPFIVTEEQVDRLVERLDFHLHASRP